jgi:hypothetical protein
LTVIVNVLAAPEHVLASGVTTKVATTMLDVPLIAVKLGCPSMPLASTPILNRVFVHG